MYFCDEDECPYTCVYEDGEVVLYEPIALFWAYESGSSTIEEIPF